MASRTSRPDMTSCREFLELGQTHPDELISLMRNVAEHDSSLVSAFPEEAIGAIATAISMSWKLSATEEAFNELRVTAPTNATAQPSSSNPTGLASDPRGPGSCSSCVPAQGGQLPGTSTRNGTLSILCRLQDGLTPDNDLPVGGSLQRTSLKRARLDNIGGVPLRRSGSVVDGQDAKGWWQ